MKTWLLTWNPVKWDWTSEEDNYLEHARIISQIGYSYYRWSVGLNKSIQPGDRIFLMRLGCEPKGIFASGYSASPVFESEHWDAQKRECGKFCRRIYVKFDIVLDFDEGHILPIDQLEEISSTYKWTTQSSGIEIPDEVARVLERSWSRIHNNIQPRYERKIIVQNITNNRILASKLQDGMEDVYVGGERVSLSEAVKNGNIKGFFFKGTNFHVSSWRSCLLTICKILYNQDSALMESFCYSEKYIGKSRNYFSREQEYTQETRMMQNTAIEGSDIYVLTNLSRDAVARFIVKILNDYGYKESEISFYLR